MTIVEAVENIILVKFGLTCVPEDDSSVTQAMAPNVRTSASYSRSHHVSRKPLPIGTLRGFPPEGVRLRSGAGCGIEESPRKLLPYGDSIDKWNHLGWRSLLFQHILVLLR